MPEKLICGLCAAEDRELHYHAEQTEDGTANGQPILVCAACDALGLEFHALDLAFLKMKIISLANGNPGALDALLRGVKLLAKGSFGDWSITALLAARSTSNSTMFTAVTPMPSWLNWSKWSGSSRSNRDNHETQKDENRSIP